MTDRQITMIVAVAENGAIGILSGGLTGAAAGISAVMLFSLLAAFLFKGKRG